MRESERERRAEPTARDAPGDAEQGAGLAAAGTAAEHHDGAGREPFRETLVDERVTGGRAPLQVAVDLLEAAPDEVPDVFGGLGHRLAEYAWRWTGNVRGSVTPGGHPRLMGEASEKRGRKQGTYRQTKRVFALVDHLSARRAPVLEDELADRFGVVRRQIKRDLVAIEEVGFEVERTELEGRPAVRLRGSRAPHPIRLSLRERYTLLAARRVFDVLEGTPFAADVQSLFDKVVASLPEGRDPERLADRFTYLPDGGTKRYAGSEDILDQLLSGVLYGHRVDCAYRSIRGNERAGGAHPVSGCVAREA